MKKKNLIRRWTIPFIMYCVVWWVHQQ